MLFSCSLAFLCCSAPFASADPASSSSLAQASGFFSAKEYAKALESYLLLEAQTDTVNTDELAYNIAVCYYRLKQWDMANNRFRALSRQQPNNPLVSYSLAVTEKKLGNTLAAQTLFLRLATSAKDEDIAKLAVQQYQLLSNASTQKLTKSKPVFMGGADLKYGVDDNVIDPTDSSGSDTNDRFLESVFSGRWLSSRNLDEAWVIDGVAYMSHYDQVSEYNIELFDLGFRKHFGTKWGSLNLGARADRTSLGGDGYLSSYSLNIGTAIKTEKSGVINIDYKFRELSELSDEFEPLSGSKHRVNIEHAFRWRNGTRLKTFYRHEIDNREDADFGVAFTSYSANRDSMGLKLSRKLGDWNLSATASYRQSKYHDDHLFIDGTSIGRKDKRTKLDLGAAWHFTPNWAISADYGITMNESNITNYDYDRQVFSIGMRWFFH